MIKQGERPPIDATTEGGFLNERGEFLRRGAALMYALEIGQITKIIGGTITSEDLW
jgi:hypothetical protein